MSEKDTQKKKKKKEKATQCKARIFLLRYPTKVTIFSSFYSSEK
jgi:hypothetical protein